jgi:ferredoxin-thioredoxin reductase catalytic subunit
MYRGLFGERDKRGALLMTFREPTSEEIATRLRDIAAAASSHGYFLNPDQEMLQGLVRGLLINEARYGYLACPCRLASGRRADDLDIVCPCDFRDLDLTEYGACYCSLYIDHLAAEGKRTIAPIPERRPAPGARGEAKVKGSPTPGVFSHPIWRCRVCGYLCARDQAPDICPICSASRERFERFG